MEWLSHLHSSQGISDIIASGGIIAITLIVFAETGLLVGFFLPGDSLMITAGVLANPLNPNHIPNLDPLIMNVSLVIAAIVGDQLGYLLGHKIGDRMWDRPDGQLYKRKHLVAAHAFYEKYGRPSIIAARYVPIMRTFVPFAAGMARMSYKTFLGWDIVGGFLWITSLLWIGYFLGQTPLANRLDKLIIIVIFVSALPLIVGGLKSWMNSKKVSAKQ
jgi:membrane-associated protein